MVSFSTVVETDSLYFDEMALDMAISRIVHKMCEELGEDVHYIEDIAISVAHMNYEINGNELFGSPTPFLRRLFHGRPNYTKISVIIENGNVSVGIGPVESRI